MTNQVVSYVMKLVSTNDVIDEIPIPLPPQHLETKAVWWTIPQAVVDRAAVSARDLPGAVHAAEHAAIGLLPLVATCDRWDVGGVSTPLHPDTGLCTIFIYDGYPGGAGIVERGFRTADRWLAATLEAITQCPCSRGMPLMRAIPQVRQRQRAARQAGRGVAAVRDPRATMGLI